MVIDDGALTGAGCVHLSEASPRLKGVLEGRDPLETHARNIELGNAEVAAAYIRILYQRAVASR